jgi:hypothetical protein
LSHCNSYGLCNIRLERIDFMKTQNAVRALSILCALSLASPILAQEGEKKAEGAKKAEGEKAEKAKAEKVSGDIGLLDTEKNYMIVVTKEGKLVTVDFDQKTKVTELKAKDAKMADIGLGSSATVQYTKKGEKNYVSGIEFTPAKGGD